MVLTFLKDKHLVKCAEVSLLSYAKSKDGIDDTKVRGWMKDIEFLGTDDDKVVYVKDSDDPENCLKTVRIYFGFRGTDTSNFGDLWDDANILKSILSDVTVGNDSGKFHKGFKSRSKKCLEQVLVKLEQLSSNLDDARDIDTFEIIFCGHSLGGAAAAVSSIRLRTKKKKLEKFETTVDPQSIMEIEGEDEVDININLTPEEQNIVKLLPIDIICVTFGAPSFGSKKNQEYCNEKRLSKQIYNVIHINDLVPKILYRTIPGKWKPSFIINAKAAIGNFKILFGDSVKDFSYNDYKEVEKNIENEDFEHTKNHHRIRSYLELLSTRSYGSTIEDHICRTNNDLKAMNKLFCAKSFIGKGSFGFVMKGISTKDGTEVAIKKISTDQADTLTVNFRQTDNNDNIIEANPEISTLKQIKHENVVEMYDCCIYHESKFYLILELCDNDLHKFVEQQGILDEKVISLVLKDCLLGLRELHKNNIIHRDIKPGNILVTERKEGGGKIYKIADLGSTSAKGGKTSTIMTVRGTKLYMSPEIYFEHSKANITVRASPKTDIFSIAASILYCGKKDYPWTEHDLKSDIFLDDTKMKEVLDRIFPNKTVLKDMLQKMLKIKYKSRPTAQDILEGYFK